MARSSAATGRRNRLPAGTEEEKWRPGWRQLRRQPGDPARHGRVVPRQYRLRERAGQHPVQVAQFHAGRSFSNAYIIIDEAQGLPVPAQVSDQQGGRGFPKSWYWAAWRRSTTKLHFTAHVRVDLSGGKKEQTISPMQASCVNGIVVPPGGFRRGKFIGRQQACRNSRCLHPQAVLSRARAPRRRVLLLADQRLALGAFLFFTRRRSAAARSPGAGIFQANWRFASSFSLRRL